MVDEAFAAELAAFLLVPILHVVGLSWSLGSEHRAIKRFLNFWRLFGALHALIWLCRAKSIPRASVYGTEGQRFESFRARSGTPVNAGVFAVLGPI